MGIPSSTDPFKYVFKNNYSLFSTPTNQFEIVKIINNLKITSPVYGDVHPTIIKQISMIIAMPLSHIISCSLISGILPYKLKTTKKKIYKKMVIMKTCIIIDLYLYCLVSQRFF